MTQGGFSSGPYTVVVKHSDLTTGTFIGTMGDHTHSVSVGNTGSGQAHSNMPPYICLNMIIKT